MYPRWIHISQGLRQGAVADEHRRAGSVLFMMSFGRVVEKEADRAPSVGSLWT
jgi:hypothetical protein